MTTISTATRPATKRQRRRPTQPSNNTEFGVAELVFYTPSGIRVIVPNVARACRNVARTLSLK